jgi:hypothetical protein
MIVYEELMRGASREQLLASRFGNLPGIGLGRRKGKCATEEGGGWFDTDSENMCIGAADRGRRF